jgi:hypothetical protein
MRTPSIGFEEQQGFAFFNATLCRNVTGDVEDGLRLTVDRPRQLWLI